MFNRILLATDFSPASRAALFAGISIGARCLAHLEALHVVTYLEDVYHAARFLVPGAEWQGQMERDFESYFPSRLYPNSNRKVVIGRSIPEEILKYARDQKCDLIIAGTHGHTVGNLLMGSVTHQLTRAAEIPIMIVRGVENAEERYQGFKNIVVPTDFSEASRKATDFAAKFANFVKGDLHLVHVVDMPILAEFQAAYPAIEMKVPEFADLNMDWTLTQMAEQLDLVGNGKVATLTGDPAREIIAYAESHHADFIIMGTHGRKGLERILLGSVTSGIVAKSRIPVITLR